ncbi:MAG TPA: glycosyltransferase family 4 protein [Pseudolabrys sp.]|nr:glycosyltransferase family 4 protein [Pseudolabrys sp.]
MNILILAGEFPPATGGIATYACEMARAATQLGAQVRVVAPDYFDADITLCDRPLPFTVTRFSGGLHAMRHAPAKIRLARHAVAQDHYDIVHAADWPFFIPLALSRGRTDGRLLLTVHGTEINEMQTRAKRLAVHLAGVFSSRTAVVANSAFTGELLRSQFRLPQHQVRPVPLGVSDFWFGSAADGNATRRALDITPERVVMVTVARLTRRKGHLATVAALANLTERLRRRVTWLVIGPDGEADYVQTLHAAIDAAGCDIRLMGPQTNERIREIYNAADFFVLTGMWDPSGRVEGFGLVYLEAGAAGLPSVATKVGGVAEAVLADKSGILVEPWPVAIAQGLARMIEDHSLRARLKAGALAHAHTLSWERCASQTYGVPMPPARDLRGTRHDVLPIAI